MSSYYPYGSVPSNSYAQPGVEVNPIGYAAPVVNPFHNLIAGHGLSKMISGMSGSSSYSSDSDVTVVTYDSYMDDKNFAKETLGMTETNLKIFGKPLGIRYKDCGLVVPIPSKVSVCRTIDKKIQQVNGGAVVSDKKKKDVLRIINENLAIEFFKTQCRTDDEFNPSSCNGLPPMSDAQNRIIDGEIYGVDASIRKVLN